MNGAEPVVVVVGRARCPRGAVLADVLIVAGEGPGSGGLFATYPGLTLVVRVGPAGAVVATFRDGTVVVVHRRPAVAVGTLSRVLYSWWVGTAPPAVSAASRSRTMSAREEPSDTNTSSA